MTIDQRSEAEKVIADAEETQQQLRRMVARLERFTDHLDMLRVHDPGGAPHD